MVNYNKLIVQSLQSIGLPVFYELFLTRETAIPCISYQQEEDSIIYKSEVREYSRIKYCIKIWSKKVADFALYSPKVDEVMRGLGFTRTATNELWTNDIGQQEIVYEAKQLEIY